MCRWRQPTTVIDASASGSYNTGENGTGENGTGKNVENIEEGLRKMEVVILALVIATLGVAAASLGAIGAIFLRND